MGSTRVHRLVAAWMLDRVSGYERSYRRYMAATIRFIDARGLATSTGIIGGQETAGLPVRSFGSLIDHQLAAPLVVLGPAGCGKTTLLMHAVVVTSRTAGHMKAPLIVAF